jgi:hypothetical protein
VFCMRLVRITDQANKRRVVLVHATDLGNVIVSKSNVSRLFGKYLTPSEKLMVPIDGQEVNAITLAGIKRFFGSKELARADPTHDYRTWLSTRLLPYMLQHASF